MDQTLQQLGELLLGSVPTVILLALLYALYTRSCTSRCRRVLAERRSKTEGAVEKSRADIAAAEARTAEYEQKLREARAAVFRAQEAQAAGRAAGCERMQLNEARSKAQAQVQRRKGRHREATGLRLKAGFAGRRGGAGAGNCAARAAAGRSGAMMSATMASSGSRKCVRASLLALLIVSCAACPTTARAGTEPPSS
jgi:F-type H+-transporting ATPase subunit b